MVASLQVASGNQATTPLLVSAPGRQVCWFVDSAAAAGWRIQFCATGTDDATAPNSAAFADLASAPYATSAQVFSLAAPYFIGPISPPTSWLRWVRSTPAVSNPSVLALPVVLR